MGKEKTVTVCDIFINIKFGDGAVGARASSRYGFGSYEMMRLRLHNTGMFTEVK
jgi:hypothetical protein